MLVGDRILCTVTGTLADYRIIDVAGVGEEEERGQWLAGQLNNNHTLAHNITHTERLSLSLSLVPVPESLELVVKGDLLSMGDVPHSKETYPQLPLHRPLHTHTHNVNTCYKHETKNMIFLEGYCRIL